MIGEKKWFFIASLFLFASSLYAEVPNEITYTGRLREYGKPTNGQRVMKFDIFPSATGGVASWSSGNMTLLVSTGVFSATLQPSVDWRGKDFWIETTVSNKVLAPREKLTAQAYALHARSAEDVEKSAGSIHFSVGASTVAVLTSDGKLGLGTATPGQTLHVAAGGVMFPDGSVQISASGAGLWAPSGSNVYLNTGSVGIGLTNPLGVLHAAGTSENIVVMQECSNDAAGPGIIAEKCRGTISNPQPVQQNDALFQVRVKPYVNGDIRDMGTHIAVIADGSPSGNNVATRISMFTAAGSGAAAERVTIKSDGKVGINETNPANTLVVNGSVTVNGSFNLLPPGLIMAYGGTSAPQGWLMCDGTAVSRTTYAALFAAIGTAFGAGDGSTTFNLPDFRGRFLRGRDAGVGRDPDRASRTAMASGGNTGDSVGSVQQDDYKSHYHILGDLNNSPAGPPPNLPDLGSANRRTHDGPNQAGNTFYAGGNETRPLNINVNYIVKH